MKASLVRALKTAKPGQLEKIIRDSELPASVKVAAINEALQQLQVNRLK